MARCKWCDKGGFFGKVSREGLCKTCHPVVVPDIDKHTGVVYEGMHVYERALTPEDKLRALGQIVDAAEYLKKYEAKGLDTCNPPPTHVAEEYGGFRADLLRSGKPRE